jgi:hypothetical protein
VSARLKHTLETHALTLTHVHLQDPRERASIHELLKHPWLAPYMGGPLAPITHSHQPGSHLSTPVEESSCAETSKHPSDNTLPAPVPPKSEAEVLDPTCCSPLEVEVDEEASYSSMANSEEPPLLSSQCKTRSQPASCELL